MRTGIFAYLASKMQKDSKTPSFGKNVLDAVKNSKGTTEEELAGEMKGVLDSMSVLKDCEAKDTLLNVVKDCFDNKEKALANEEELTKTLDSMWVDIHGDSLKEIAKAFAKLSEKPSDETAVADKQTDSKDEEKKSDEKTAEKTEDSKDEKKSDEEKTEDSKDEDKSKDGCGTKDSAPVMTKDDMLSALSEMLPGMVESAVKSVLGIKEGAKPQVDSGVIDSTFTGKTEGSERDYSAFLD